MSASIHRLPVISNMLLFGADKKVAELVGRQIPSIRATGGFGDDIAAIGIIRGGTLAGGAVFNNYRGFDIHAHIAFLTPLCSTPATWRALFSYPFLQVGCTRLTAPIGKKNKRSRRLIEYLGFELEGCLKKGLDGQEDLMIYGMLKPDCRWIRPISDKKEPSRG